MSEPTRQDLESLETELRSLRPVAPRADVEQRVGRALAARAGTPRAGLWLAAGALAAAACVVIGAAVALRGIGNPRADAPRMAVTVPVRAGGTEGGAQGGDERPAWVNYRRALSRSPADLDELLDRHAERSLSGGPQSAPAVARVTAASDFGFLR